MCYYVTVTSMPLIVSNEEFEDARRQAGCVWYVKQKLAAAMH